jgi:hypothetical protein
MTEIQIGETQRRDERSRDEAHQHREAFCKQHWNRRQEEKVLANDEIDNAWRSQEPTATPD